MKLSKLLLAGAIAVSAASAHAADVNLHYTGATAFRQGAVNGIRNWFLSSPAASDLKVVYTQGSTLTGATQQGFYGTKGGVTYFVSCKWSGSGDGVNAVAKASPVAVTDFFTEAATIANGDNDGNPLPVAGNSESSITDGGFSDNSQLEARATPGHDSSYVTVQSESIGVIPFVWVRGKGAEGSAEAAALNRLTGLTPLQIQLALGGYAGANVFTGNSDDNGVFVNVVGRASNSGTRINAFLESGFGLTTNPVQFSATIDAGVITGFTEQAANDGVSATQIAAAANATVSNGLGEIPIGYVAIVDAGAIAPLATVEGDRVFTGPNAAQILKFNGVAYSDNAVKNGTYTFWNYEWLLRRPGLTAQQTTAYDGIRNQIRSADAGTAGIRMDDMNVERDGSGQIVVSKI